MTQHPVTADGRGADDFDLIVIGSGPAGEKAAAQAAYFGKRVILVEIQPLVGGAMVGSAVASKTMREAAAYLTSFRHRDVYGVGMGLAREDAQRGTSSRTAAVVQTGVETVRTNLDRHGIEVITGRARLAERGTVHVETADISGARTLRGRMILIATGSRPLHPPDIDFEDPDVFDSDSARTIDHVLPSLAIVGGGAIACEYASIFMALGSKVVIVDRSTRLMRYLDQDLSESLADSFRAAGMRLVLNAGRCTVLRDSTGLAVLAGEELIRVDAALIAVGRVGNTDGLGLEQAGVAVDERGRIIVDEQFQTSATGIYAAGDVIASPALASVAMEEGRVAVCYGLGISFKDTVDPLAPAGVFTIPEVAMVGLTEAEARDRGVDYAVGRGRFETNSRAVIAGSTEGLVKLVFDRTDRRLLGVHIIGDSATELIHQGQAAIHFGATIDYFIHTAFNVPTLSEAYKYAAYDGLQNLNRT